jgi:hypothetical protein
MGEGHSTCCVQKVIFVVFKFFSSRTMIYLYAGSASKQGVKNKCTTF